MKKFALVLLLITGIFWVSGCTNQEVSDKIEQPRNVILLIGDGMGLSQVTAALTVNGGHLNMLDCTAYGFITTHSASDYVTDSGAGGTAISTGVRTYNGAIGVGPDSLPRKTILEYAEEHGLATGLISTSSVTHATPASFIAHQLSRNNYEGIAADFLKTEVDVVIGGGADHFNKRSDSLDLLRQLTEAGYLVTHDLNQIDPTGSAPFYVFTAKGHNPRFSEGRENMLPDATELAARALDARQKGFFLMVEGSMIDWGGHAQDQDYIIEETLDFDRAVGKALEFAKMDGQTLVVVTADHETSGMGLNDGSLLEKSVSAGYTTSGHTGVMVPVFAFGPGSDAFTGVQKNTDLFKKMMDLLSLSEKVD